MRILILLILTVSLSCYSQKNLTISGHVYEKGSKESLVGVNIYIPELKSGTTTNNYGFYSITIPKGKYKVYYSYIGYHTIKKELTLDKDFKSDIYITPENELEEIVIKSKKKRISQMAQMSRLEIPISQIKNIPSFLGEKDVLKALQLMPGVQSGSEANAGIYVRGGGPDQNLIILDDAPVYNANHLFGFFSIFNGDALKSVSLTKGGFPAQYGGRLSSVLEMTMKDGNKEKISGEVGLGLISSRATLEGPIIKDKSSFLISGRRTYIDLLTEPFMDKNKTGYYFYDFNAKANYDFNDRDKLYLSSYFGQDRFKSIIALEHTDSEGKLAWGNMTGTLRWNHLFNNKTFANTSLIYSNYDFGILNVEKRENDVYELKYNSGIKDFGLKYDMQYNRSPKYTLKTGFSWTTHAFNPSAIVLKNSTPDQKDIELTKKSKITKTTESGSYIENRIKLSNKLHMNAGLRLSHYRHPKKSYYGIEPRFSGSYSFTKNFSTKASYAKMNQFVHLLSSTGVNLPLDLWVPTTNKVSPQKSQQIAVGLAQDFIKQNFSFSTEAYYKKMDQIIGYKPGANFLLINDPRKTAEYSWEDSIMRGQGWSYGLEFLLQRKVGRLSGWIGYTLSWTEHQFDLANGGEKFFAKYDRRHDFSIVSIYKIKDHITLSGTWVYGTGNNISLATDKYIPESSEKRTVYLDPVESYGKKNSTRMEPYHRLDIGIQFHKKKKKYERTWDIGFYNVYMRANPFFYFVETNSETDLAQNKLTSWKENNKLMKIALFPIVPSVSYNIKF